METETKIETKTETKMEAKTETETETETPLRETEVETRSFITQLPVPRFIVIRENPPPSTPWYVHYREDGSIPTRLLNVSVFSPMVKIEVERAKSNPNHVHLRFCHSNRYWHQSATSDAIVAESTEPEEDASNRLCTLFSFERTDVVMSNGARLFAIVHLHSGVRVGTSRNYELTIVHNNSISPFVIIDWSALVSLPPHVAFKGYNDKYLRAVIQDRHYNYHKFESDDPNERQCGYEVHHMNDGHLRIKSDHWGMFWRRSPNWIWGTGLAGDTFNKDTLFWPVLLDDNTIALRNAGNDRFCMALSAEGKKDCLNAGATTTSEPTRLVVEELVNGGKIYNIRYRMEHSRIFDESPYLAGSSSVTNNTDKEASMDVEISYTNEESYTFSNSISVMAGVKKTFEGGIPKIAAGQVEVYMEGTYTREWGQTVTTSQTIKASGTVVVPPRSVALISYVGAKGTCNVPFSYTQQDRSSANGAITETEKIDGIFEGVNSYNFQFVLTSTRSL